MKIWTAIKETISNCWIVVLGVGLFIVFANVLDAEPVVIHAEWGDMDLDDEYELAARELAGWFRKDLQRDKREIVKRAGLGVYFDDVDFKDAYELQYDSTYGVLIEGSKSADYITDQGLREDDILMEMDGQKLYSADDLYDLLDEKEIGDSITVVYFRRGRIQEMPILLQPRHDYSRDTERFAIGVTKSAGLGGISYKPMVLGLDNGPVNDLLTDLGFKTLPDDYSVYHGFDLNGLVGDGFFVGGTGCWTRRNMNALYEVNPGVELTRSIIYSSGLGGVTLDKRLRLHDRLIISTGFMVGGGGTRMEIRQLDESIDWTDLEKTEEGFFNDYLELKKRYFVFQPRMAAMYRVLPVFWIRVEAGYNLSYSKEGWFTTVDENRFDIIGPARHSSMDGWTLSIGPWFGF